MFAVGNELHGTIAPTCTSWHPSVDNEVFPTIGVLLDKDVYLQERGLINR